MLLVHANGFCKEVLYPLSQKVEKALRAGGLHQVTAVSMDLLGHGDAEPLSYRWDREMQAAEVDWEAYGTQVRRRIQEELRGMASDSEAPLIFALGHSIGGAACVLAAMQAERVFDGLVLFEPVLIRGLPRAVESPVVRGTLARRSSFASPAEALAWFQRKALFATVCDEALRLYCEHGLRSEAGAWVLKCKPEVEAANFATGFGQQRFEQLQNGQLLEPIRILTGARSTFKLKQAYYDDLLSKCPDVTFETVDSGHLGPMEHPGLLADVAARTFLEWADIPPHSRL